MLVIITEIISVSTADVIKSYAALFGSQQKYRLIKASLLIERTICMDCILHSVDCILHAI